LERFLDQHNAPLRLATRVRSSEFEAAPRVHQADKAFTSGDSPQRLTLAFSRRKLGVELDPLVETSLRHVGKVQIKEDQARRSSLASSEHHLPLDRHLEGLAATGEEALDDPEAGEVVLCVEDRRGPRRARPTAVPVSRHARRGEGADG